MRVALVSPYSWSHPGGVNRHVEALARELAVRGHEVRAFAPVDLRRGAGREAPPWLVGLGGTTGWAFNGSVSHLALHPTGVLRLRRELRAFAPDVVHLHEPVAPTPGWDTLTTSPAPLVGTFHTHATRWLPFALATAAGSRRRLNRLAVRIAVSEAAAWTGRRFYGGEYRIVPNGVALPPGGTPPRRARADGEPLRVVFVGQAVARKGLPVLLEAFAAVRREVPVELTVVGGDHPGLPGPLAGRAGVRALGRVDDARKAQELAAADVLVAPSLGGESFGMVLTEAFAAGTPVIASDIPGYREVVRDGEEGLLVPPGDAGALAAALRWAARDRERLARAGATAARTAQRYAWPRIAAGVERAYADAVALPAARGVAARVGLRPADGGPRVPARRLPPPGPAAPRRARGGAAAWRALPAVGAVAALAGAGAALAALGLDAVGGALAGAAPAWVLTALAVMAASMAVRALAWHAILRAALPASVPRFGDAMLGTAIGVLVSATLPARLGEPARAVVVARRLGHGGELLAPVLGTLVAQTLLNVAALAVLAVALLPAAGALAGGPEAAAWAALVPAVLLGVVLAAPAVLGARGRLRRHATRVRRGLAVFRRPRTAAVATGAQATAWGLQCLACHVLLVALGLDGQAGPTAAAAVLFAVNASAVLPVTPANVGVFQAACVAVLTGAHGVPAADALAYGIALQAVELATALVMGVPALVREGVSWRDVRRSTLLSPVRAPAPMAAVDDGR